MNSNPQICYNSSTFKTYCQHGTAAFIPSGEVLSDIANDGKERPWREKKMRNMRLADIYAQFNPEKEARLRDCGKFLDFRLYPDGTKKLHSMSSCRVRLCPICSWRRSLKTFHNNLKIIEELKKNYEYNFIFLTFTVRNCQAHELADTIELLNVAVHRLYQRDEWKRAVKGACRCLEITHNVDKNSRSYDTYHPHLHYVIAVNKSYYKSPNYLSHDKWVEIWKSVLHADYSPIVDVRACYGTDAKIVAECSKYSVKDAEFIVPDDWELSVKTVKLLDELLEDRRLITYTGCFKATRAVLIKKKKIEDEQKGSLVNVGEDDEEEKLGKDYILQSYCWYTGYRQYVCINYDD